VRPPFSLAVLVAVLAVTPALATAGGNLHATTVRSAIFYYPWYGNPSHDGVYEHWQQNGGRPPQRIASTYFPARGVYSSGDRAVVSAQMREIAATGVDQVVVSWWGRGSLEDRRLSMTVAAARAVGLSVAAHVEPYRGRSAASVEADIAHLRLFGITDLYVYGSNDLPANEWAALNDRLAAPVRIFAQTGRVGLAAAGRFDGIYTYDVLSWGGGTFRRICTEAHAAGLLCAPSVAPGYDARRASGDLRVKARRAGATYDAMWQAALGSGGDFVTITSYNEWHEGTQVEPARVRVGYRSYEWAWGRRGRQAETAYVDRTADWVTRLEERAR